MFDEISKKILNKYDENVRLVIDLMEFDRIVLNFVITMLEKHEEKLRKTNFNNPYLSIETPLKGLRNIRENDSLRKKYQAIVNQGVVLLVSYFSSSLTELFCESINYIANKLRPKKLLNETIELSIEELLTQNKEENINIGSFIVKSKDISFQDMKSVGRVFKDYLNYEPKKSEEVNNIIVAQACRHVIVHSGGIIDQKLLNQLKDAFPRTVKSKIVLKDKIWFSRDEIEICAASMRKYLEIVSGDIQKIWAG